MSPYSFLDLIQERYPRPGCLKAYRALCLTMRGRTAEVDWAGFSPSDWDLFGDMASRDAAAGLIYHAWQGGKRPKGAPVVLIAQLGAAFRKNELQFNTCQTELCSRVGPALAAAGQKVIILKGVALADALFPHPGTRPMHDIDCLVRQEELPAVWDTLVNLNYSANRDAGFFPGVALDRHHFGLVYDHTPKVFLELHYALTNPRGDFFHIDMDWFFQQTRPLSGTFTGQDSLLTFTPAAHLLHLMIHLMLHHGEGDVDLLHFYDIHLLLERWGGQINWDDLLETTRRMNLDYVVFSALRSCAERFNTPIPEVFRPMPAGPRVRAAKDFVETRKKRIFSSHAQLQINALADRPLKSKVDSVLRYAFPSPEFIRGRYQQIPVWIWPLGYPFRWLIGMKQVFKTLFRHR